jgi:hypothetical protein
LALLKGAFEREGTLSHKIISADPRLPNAHFFETRFGSLIRAYHLVGCNVDLCMRSGAPACARTT